MKTVLVTGGAGYIGSHTVVELLQRQYDVVIVDNYVNSDRSVIDRIQTITGKRPYAYDVDIRDRDALEKVFASHQVDAVIHFAGLKAVGESVDRPILYYNNNVIGTIVLLEVMNKHNCSNIIFSSSATVYGDPQRLPIDEDCALSTTNPYGATKLVIEYLLQDLAAADRNWTVSLLRYFNPIGAHASGLIGENPVGIPNNLTPYISQVASGKLPYLKIFGADYDTVDGTGVRDYIHVVDLALGHIAALEYVLDKGVHIYNLGTGKGYSVLEVLRAFEKACGKTLPYEIVQRRAGDIASSYASCSKAYKELRWQANLDIDDMCSSLWKWQQYNANELGN